MKVEIPIDFTADTKVDDLFVCGGIHPENSLSTKVDEMYRENQGMKNFIKGCVIALITLIFWCGYQFATLQNCVQRIEKLEVKIGQLSK